MSGRSPVRASWMLTFADTLGILLCFLVLAYALSAAPQGAQERALASLREVFRPGSENPSGAPLAVSAPRGGNYWATWLEARVGGIPSLAGREIVAHGATARLALSDGATMLTENDLAMLAGVLNGSGAAVVIRAGAASNVAADWLEAGRAAQALNDRLVAAGLRQTPRIVVSGGGPLVAVEIGRKEP